jgi:tetratricopeptide (TPR) repeat protein
MPGSWSAYAELAQACFDAGDYASSVRYNREAIARNPKVAAVWNNLGATYGRTENKAECCAALAKAVELKPKEATTYIGYADALRALGKYSQAIEVSQKTASMFPSNTAVLVALGNLHGLRNCWPEAFQAYQQALRQDQNCVEAVFGIARSFQGVGRLADAIPIYAQVVNAAPTNVPYRCALVDCLVKSGHGPDAHRVIDEGLAQSPTNVDLMVAMSGILNAEHNATGAVAVLERALVIAPHQSIARYNLACLYHGLGRLDLAVSNCQIVAVSDPSFPWSHNMLGQVYGGAGRLDEALAEFTKYVERLPEDPIGHNDLGYTYFLLKRHEDAIREYQTALALDPQNGLMHYNLALAYDAQGNKVEALKACLKAQSCGYAGNPQFLEMLRQK